MFAVLDCGFPAKKTCLLPIYFYDMAQNPKGLLQEFISTKQSEHCLETFTHISISEGMSSSQSPKFNTGLLFSYFNFPQAIVDQLQIT